MIIATVLLIYVALVAQVTIVFIVTFFQLSDPNYQNSFLNEINLMLNLNVYPVIDFLIGLGFSYLYYT